MKTEELFDVTPKTKTNGRKITSTKPLDIQKQNVKALNDIDYACLRMHEIWELLKYELAPISCVLTKENKLRKPEKHHLPNALEAKLKVSPPKYVPIDDKKTHFFFILWHMQGKQ